MSYAVKNDRSGLRAVADERDIGEGEFFSLTLVELVVTHPDATLVSMRQIQRALFSAGLLDQVERAIATLPEGQRELALIDWRTAREVRKDDQWVQALTASLLLSEAELTALFNAAATIPS